MRFIRIIFSRTLLVILSILAQFAFLIYFIYRPTENVYIFQTVCMILSFFAFLHLVSKNSFAEFKLPWMFLLLVFPIMGLILYLLFANRKLSARQIKSLRKAKEQMKNATLPTHDKRAVKDFLEDDLGLEQYLINTADSYGHLNNKAIYFPSGESFFEDIKKELVRAEKFIFLEYFVVAKGKMWKEIHQILVDKAKAGVDVRIIYDDIGSLGRVSTKFYKHLRKEGIKAVKFSPFKPIISGVHNNRDHRKIAVIDGVVGYSGGINIADEYINHTHPHGHWKDSAIKIQGSAVANLTTMFLETYDSETKTISDYKKFLYVHNQEYNDAGYVHPFADSPKPFCDEAIGEGVIINILNNAKKYVYITTPYLVIDYTLTTALRNASLRGVDVRIITPSIPDKKIVFNVTRSHYKHLLDSGVKIFEYTPGFIHAKNIISDDKIAMVGTINLDYRSLAHHFECAVLLYKAPCIKDIKKDFDATFEVSKEITTDNFKMSKFVSLVNSTLAIFFPLL